LERFLIYKVGWILLIIVALIVPVLRYVVHENRGYYEVIFGLLLGLWGTHDLLVPDYIETSVPVDVLFFLLYGLVVSEIVRAFISNFLKPQISIRPFSHGEYLERLVIENSKWFYADISNCYVTDYQSRIRYKFNNDITRIGRGRSKSKIVLWTNKEQSPEDNDEDTLYFYWERNEPIWQDRHETIYLKNQDGQTIAVSSNE